MQGSCERALGSNIHGTQLTQLHETVVLRNDVAVKVTEMGSYLISRNRPVRRCPIIQGVKIKGTQLCLD